MMKEYKGFTYITDPLFSEFGIPHLFTTIKDEKKADFSFNTGEREAVLKSYEKVAEILGAETASIVKSTQIHKDDIVEITDFHKGMGIVRETALDSADGIFTMEKGIPLCIFSADCVPVLIADKNKKIVFGVHAGWRGTALDITGKAVRILKEKINCENEDIICLIGPAVGKCCYEVSEDVIKELEKIHPVTDCCEKKENEKYMLDLKKFNKLLLIKEGIPCENIRVSELCTACEDELFHSYRRDGASSGRNAAFIMI